MLIKPFAPTPLGAASVPDHPPGPSVATTTPVLSCKECDGGNLTPMSGRYGPYANCQDCESNTAARLDCPTCGAPIKLKPVSGGFEGSCAGCGHAARLTF